MRREFLSVALALGFAACASVPPGKIQNPDVLESDSIGDLRRRAEVDLGCVSFTLSAMSEFKAGFTGSPYDGAQVAAAGCGKSAVYVKVDGNWILNSTRS
jgi:hypothetical protein